MRVWASLCLALSLVLAACRTAPTSPELPWRIGASFVDIDEPTELIQRGVVQSASAPVEKVRWNSAGNSLAKQRADLDEYFGEPVDVLILQPADAEVLAYARARAAAKGIPLIWIREPRIGPIDPPPDLSRVETDWTTAFRSIPDTGPDQVQSTRPAEKEGLLAAIRSACAPNPAGCAGLMVMGPPGAGSGPALALDEDSLRRLVPPAAGAGAGRPPWALAGEGCARGLYAGTVGGCLDTRPFEIGRAALALARQALAACNDLTPALSGAERENVASPSAGAAPSPGARQEVGQLSRAARVSRRPLSLEELAEIGTAFPPNGCGLAAARRQPEAVPVAVRGLRSAVAIVPRWVGPSEAAALTYRWPDLLLRSGTDVDRVVGDGID